MASMKIFHHKVSDFGHFMVEPTWGGFTGVGVNITRIQTKRTVCVPSVPQVRGDRTAAFASFGAKGGESSAVSWLRGGITLANPQAVAPSQDCPDNAPKITLQQPAGLHA